MTITKELILENQKEVASVLASEYQESKFGEVMVKMLLDSSIEEIADCANSIEEYTLVILEMAEFAQYSKKDSKLVKAFNSAHENESYDILTKEFKNLSN